MRGGLTSATAYAAAGDNATRAAQAYAAMQTQYYISSSKLYHEFAPYDSASDEPNGYLWSFEEAAKATLAMYGTPDGATYRSAALDRYNAREQYWDGGTARRAYRSYPGTGDRYYDDNCWVGSDLLQHNLLLSTDPSSGTALNRAKNVFTYIQGGWTTNLPKPGGVR